MERVENDNRRKPTVDARARRPRSATGATPTTSGSRSGRRASPAAPFVGLLRYGEQLFSCSDTGATRCGVAHTTPVTEIFRFQNGRWVY